MNWHTSNATAKNFAHLFPLLNTKETKHNKPAGFDHFKCSPRIPIRPRLDKTWIAWVWGRNLSLGVANPHRDDPHLVHQNCIWRGQGMEWFS